MKKVSDTGLGEPLILKACILFVIYFSASVLASVKQFLPMMQEANRKLDNVPADEVNIECVSDTDDQVIEMVCCFFELLEMISFNKLLNISASIVMEAFITVII